MSSPHHSMNVFYAVCGLIFLSDMIDSGSNSMHQNGIMQFNSVVTPTIDPNSICLDFNELSSRQIRLCRQQPHATASAMQGVLHAIHECKRQFKDHRWNCSNLNSYVVNKHPFLSRGFKETAFAQAMIAAGVLQQVAVACSLGKINSCSCQDHLAVQASNDFQWRGCSHDLKFGSKYSRRFLNKKYKGTQTIHSMMLAHNSKLGRKAVLNQKGTKCKCHGMSSSCEVKTCWLAAPDIKNVGDRLRNLYDKSVKVDRTNSVRGKIIPIRAIETNIANQRLKSSKKLKKHMVFYENSPSYCRNDRYMSFTGTSGRTCNRIPGTVNSCNSLCCGRGFFTVKVHHVEKCHCKFHWCCYVECQRCEYDEWITVCK